MYKVTQCIYDHRVNMHAHYKMLHDNNGDNYNEKKKTS